MSHAMHAANRAVFIAGPTASGKSALAFELAKRINGVIINADSMQVYRDLRIVTARPTSDDEKQVPHRLYGFVDAAENYSVGRWRRDVEEALNRIEEGRIPILVGGTGLYFKALTTGLAAVPPIPADIREQVRGRMQSEGAPSLHSELARLDPASAQRVTVNDRSRISRALEVVLATGRPLSDWHLEGGLPPIIDPARAARSFVTCERKELVRRIETRFAIMLKAGALEEVRALAARGLDPSVPAMKAHGVPRLIRHLAGEISFEEATAGAVMDTRRYAKRQLTWFRNQMKNWPWDSPENAISSLQAQLSGIK